MGRKKTQLLARDHYARLFATLRCAALFRAQLSGVGPIELRLEDSRFAPWDDLSELHQDESGNLTWHVWQVKRQRTLLEPKDFKPLLKALGKRADLTAHFMSYEPVKIRGVGTLNCLDEICQRARSPGFNPRAETEWSKDEQKWISFVRETLGCTDSAALSHLRRLHVEPLGSEEKLREEISLRLERYFSEPEKVRERLISFLASHSDEAVLINIALLNDQLWDFERQPNSGSASLVSLRKLYLQAVIDSYGRLSPLRLLSGLGTPNASGPRLSDVFALPALRPSVDEEAPLQLPQEARLKGNVVAPPREEEPESVFAAPAYSHTEPLRLVELLLDSNRLAERPLFLVEGRVGAGKSTLLEHLLLKLATRALQEAEAPLPLRVEARRLSEGLAEAMIQGTPHFDARLLQAGSPGFVFLVDGLDEVDRSRTLKVQACLEELSRLPSTRAIVMVGRPLTAYFDVPSGTTRLQISPWSRVQLKEFLDKWRQHEPDRVAAMERWVRTNALMPALSNPLTATFALLLAGEEPDALTSRVRLFRGVMEKLFTDWVTSRAPREGAPPLSWATIAPAFRQLALESLKAGKESLSRTDLRKHMGRQAVDRELEWTDEAHRRFGLLIYQEDGHYRFLLKGLAEHLAGAALLEQGQREILAAARQRWAEEPVRHAIGLGLERNGPTWATDTLRKLLPGHRGIEVSEVRPLLVAARVCIDLGEAETEVAESIAEALCSLMVIETSVWIQKVVGSVIRELALAGGACWESLFKKLTPLLKAHGHPGEWYAAQQGKDSSFWLEALRHRAVEVRQLAVKRLSTCVDEPMVRSALLEQLSDDSMSISRGSPAVEAGVALRSASRDEDFHRILPALVEQAQSGGQLIAGAAALALRPGEAPIRLLAGCLRRLHSGPWHYPEIVRELATSPETEAELTAVWEDWRVVTPSPQSLPTNSGTSITSPFAPLSPIGRRQVSWALAPSLLRWTTDDWQWLERSMDGHVLTRALCEVAREVPQRLVIRLQQSRSWWLPPDAEVLLGEAAASSPPLRSALLDHWNGLEDEHERSIYPGGALAALVAQGDEEAAEVFAQWLRVTVWLNAGLESVFISPLALRHPTVRDVALEHATNTWRSFTVGEVRESRRTTLFGGVMASRLGALRPAWEDTPSLMMELIRVAQEGDSHALTHVLEVFTRPPYPRQLGDILVARFGELSTGIHDDRLGHVGFWIDWAHRASISDRMQSALEKIRTWSSWHHYTATLALMETNPTRASKLSQEAARTWPNQWVRLFLRRTTLSRLVRANVPAWRQRFFDVIKQSEIPVWSIFDLAQILVPLLDSDQRHSLCEELRSTLGWRQRCWMRNGENSWSSATFADMYGQVLFEAGA